MSGAQAFRWKDAWDTIDDGSEFQGVEQYPLPDREGVHIPSYLYEGDQFWDAEWRCLITVTDVKTKVYKGVVGPAGDEGADHVFFETDRADWFSHRRGWTDPDKHANTFVHVDDFADRLVAGRYEPHTDNGLPTIP